MSNPYIPNLAVIEEMRDEAPDVRTFRFRLIDREKQEGFSFIPGQFVELTVFNYGEAPFSLSSSPLEKRFFELTVKRTGVVTNALFRLKEGDVVGIRGPFGNGWPIEEMRNENILLIGGGIGLVPLRPLIKYILENRGEFGEVILLYGARTPKDIVFKKELEEWRKDIDVHLTVDRGDESWSGRVGVVTVLFDEIEVDPNNTFSVQCGPPIMMHFVTKKLRELGFAHERISLSLERQMKCGMGFCGHCMVSGRFVCKDGPVFKYDVIETFLERAV